VASIRYRAKKISGERREFDEIHRLRHIGGRSHLAAVKQGRLSTFSEVRHMATERTGDAAPRVSVTKPTVSFRASAEELEVLAALRRGDESAFTRLVTAHHSSLLRVARMYVSALALKTHEDGNEKYA
jgi:hypothetical protein